MVGGGARAYGGGVGAGGGEGGGGGAGGFTGGVMKGGGGVEKRMGGGEQKKNKGHTAAISTVQEVKEKASARWRARSLERGRRRGVQVRVTLGPNSKNIFLTRCESTTSSSVCTLISTSQCGERERERERGVLVYVRVYTYTRPIEGERRTVLERAIVAPMYVCVYAYTYKQTRKKETRRERERER